MDEGIETDEGGVIDGSILIGDEDRSAEPRFRAFDRVTGEAVGPAFASAGPQHVAEACALAEAASTSFGALAPEARAHFLALAATAIEAIGDALIVTAMAESGLPRARLEGERARTTGQLRQFAAELRRGEWVEAVIEHGLPERSPPRPDLRRMNVPLGPVAVFGASNFPLAFSVTGGDTASAFAAGCPVVVKGHPAHPGTGELVARAIRSAVQEAGLPSGVFSYLPGTDNALGAALVADPRIQAVGFTGSRAGGLALLKIANARANPIPLFAEMSSINPVLLLPEALAADPEGLAQGFATSLTMGAGQFCTNPGLVLAIDGESLDRFVAAAAARITQGEPAVMLSDGIAEAFRRGVGALGTHPAVTRATVDRQAPTSHCAPALFECSAAAFLEDAALAQEVFGASSLIVRCADAGQLAAVIHGLEGQLTATIHAAPGDEAIARRLLPLLQEKAGRLLMGGWPTGVEVSPAMVHGGPFPATSDSRFTSVGTLAMRRFLRPVCYQSCPDALLPPALQGPNPWRLPRWVDGVREPSA